MDAAAEKKNQVGLCVTFRGANYGMLLQCFATQHVVESLGLRTHIIDYQSGRNKGIAWSWQAAWAGVNKLITRTRKKMLKRRAPAPDQLHRQNIAQRKAVAQAFRDEYLHDFVSYRGIDQLRSASARYSAVLVGSDQLWLPDVAFSNFYTLRFAQPGVTRVSYATSMGVSSYPGYVKKAAADYWSKIDFLSVREQQAKELIQSIVDVPVQVVADPTYLLTPEQWLEIIPQEKVIHQDYVLCYFLSHDPAAKASALAYARERGLKCAAILSNECNADDSQFDLVLTGQTPQQFMNLIRGARAVFTDSFHGVAFCVINSRPFYVFYRQRQGFRGSRNSRIDNILRTWGLEDRLVEKPENYAFDEKPIDYRQVQAKVSSLREESLSFLRKALVEGKN